VEEIFAPIGGHKNGCSLAEYLHVARLVRGLAPCRFLVFGAGEDSAGWVETNSGGTTLFLENDAGWREKIAPRVAAARILQVEYAQSFEAWEAAGFPPGGVSLPGVAEEVLDGDWDIAFVDAPWGPTYGRHQSTWAATRAVRPGGFIALHDCDRDREQAVCRHVLEAHAFTLHSATERLRVYRAP
jgi:hypothetical protein